MATRRTLSWKKKLGFALGLVTGVILLSEIALRLAGYPQGVVRSFSRLWSPEPEARPGLFRPGEHRISWPRELEYTARINELGLRGPDASPEKADGSLRILALGDSVTFGYYVENDETWPAYLRTKLSKGKRPVEVLNAGCGHFSIPDERTYLEERLLALKPDVVVLQFCSNDVSERELEREPTLYAKIASGKAAKGSWVRRTALGEAQLLLALRLKQWSRERSGDWPPKGFPANEKQDVPDARWERYERELGELKQLLDEAEVPLVMTAFADLHEVEEGAEPSPYEGKLVEITGRLKIPFRGVWTRYREASDPKELYHWPLDPHPSAKGNEVLAEVVVTLLRDAKHVD